MSAIFNTIFYKPLLNGLIYVIGVLPMHDIGLAIILLTIAVRIIIFPLSHKATVTQKKIKELEPKLKEIKNQYKDSKEQAQKTMDLYKEHGVSPFSLFSFFALFLQLPIFFAMYKVFAGGMNFNHGLLYPGISIPVSISKNFLGAIDITSKSFVMAVLAGISQFIQIRLAVPPIKKTEGEKSDFKQELAKSMNLQMRYFMPIFIFFIATRLPAAMALYWLTMNVFSIVHESVVRKKAKSMLSINT